MQRLKILLLAIMTVFTLGTAVLPVAVMADGKDSACAALNQLGSGQGCGSDASKNVLSSTVATVVNILSLVLGAVAVIMIIVAGFKYITSGGDSNAVGSAKNTLLYAIVGLVLASLAQAIVHFVLTHV